MALEAARDCVSPQGRNSEVADLKVGDVFWSGAETHTEVNIGVPNSKLIVEEIQ